MKKCNKCGGMEKKTFFTKNKANKDGLSIYCKNCSSLSKKKTRERGVNKNDKNYIGVTWTKKPKQSEISRLNAMYSKYGMTFSDYEEMVKEQNGLCAICGCSNSDKKLVVDHCHSTDRVRGLLCFNCNIGLGFFKDSIGNLGGAIVYLKM